MSYADHRIYYGMGPMDSMQSMVARANARLQPSAGDRRRASSVRTRKAKAAIRRIPNAERDSHVRNMMQDFGLTEGKVRTLIARVRRTELA